MNEDTEYPAIPTIFAKNDDGIVVEHAWTWLEFNHLRNCDWDFMEWAKGVGVRILFRNGDISVLGRRSCSQLSPFIVTSVKHLATQPGQSNRRTFGGYNNICIYATCFGPGVTERKSRGNNIRVVAFDSTSEGQFIAHRNLGSILYGTKIIPAPIVGSGTLADAVIMAKNGVTRSYLTPSLMDGIIVMPALDLLRIDSTRIIGMLSHSDFYGKTSGRTDF